MSINDIQDRIIEEMSALDEWTDRYEYLINAAKNLEPLDDILKTEENLISGCQSRVWLTVEIENEKMHFRADSDATITKGILRLMLHVLNDQSPGDIADSDLYFITRTGLSSHLSPARANGMALIVKRIKEYAAAYDFKSNLRKEGN